MSDDDVDRDEVMRLFKGRCVMNYAEAAVCVHHIVPRGMSSQASSHEIANQVSLCHEHHLWAHQSTHISIPILQAARLRALKFFGVIYART